MYGNIVSYSYEQKLYSFLELEKFELTSILERYSFYLGINPFDIYILERCVQEFQIKSALELGCGSSSIILDMLGIERQSYAQNSPDHRHVTFKKTNLYETMPALLNKVKAVDLLFIDCEHSSAMASKYIPLLNSCKGLIFIHDWHLPGEPSWEEQQYLVSVDILNAYNDYCITRHFLKNCEGTNIPPCSLLLWNRK